MQDGGQPFEALASEVNDDRKRVETEGADGAIIGVVEIDNEDVSSGKDQEESGQRDQQSQKESGEAENIRAQKTAGAADIFPFPDRRDGGTLTAIFRAASEAAFLFNAGSDKDGSVIQDASGLPEDGNRQ